MDKHNAGNACFIDLKIAFDTLYHNISLHKIEKFSFRGKTLCLLFNYRENRQQYVEHNRNRFLTKDLKTGVRQRSVLGSFLFLIYIIDLPIVCEKSKRSPFADDTTVYKMGRNSEKTSLKMYKNAKIDANKVTRNVEK